MPCTRKTTLQSFPRGKKVRVMALDGSPPTCSRLCALGITPGTEIEICRAGSGDDCMLVRVRNASLVLGSAMSQAVECECLASPSGDNDSRFHYGKNCSGRRGTAAV